MQLNKDKLLKEFEKADNYSLNDLTMQAWNLIQFLIEDPWVSNKQLDITSNEVISKAADLLNEAYDSIDNSFGNEVTNKIFDNAALVDNLKNYFSDIQSKQICSTEDFF